LLPWDYSQVPVMTTCVESNLAFKLNPLIQNGFCKLPEWYSLPGEYDPI